MRARLLLVLAVVGTVASTGCGGGGHDDAPPARTTVRSTTVEVRGLEFAARLPASWTDVKSQITEDVTQYDAAYGDRTVTGFKPTVIVDRERTEEIRSQSIEKTVAGIRAAISDAEGSTSKPGPETRVDGTPAYQEVTEGRQGGQQLVKRQVFAKHNGTLYTVAFTYAKGDASTEATVRSFLASWRWTGGADSNPDDPVGSG